ERVAPERRPGAPTAVRRILRFLPDGVIEPAHEHREPAVGVADHRGPAGPGAAHVIPVRERSAGADFPALLQRAVARARKQLQAPVLILSNGEIEHAHASAHGGPGGPGAARRLLDALPYRAVPREREHVQSSVAAQADGDVAQNGPTEIAEL